MKVRDNWLYLTLALGLAVFTFGQGTAPRSNSSPAAPVPSEVQSASPKSGDSRKERPGALAPVRQLRIETLKVDSELATVFAGLSCDRDGNLYLRELPNGASSGILKLDPKGKRLAVLQAKTTDFKSGRPGSFSVEADGDVYQLVRDLDSFGQYVFVYKPDGEIRSEVKLESGFVFVAHRVAAFSPGNLFVTGAEFDKDPKNPIQWPFQGIFSSSGSLLKELKFQDDEKIHDLAASGDPHVVPTTDPSGNLALSGSVETGTDGNVYVMRRLSPTIFYAISPGGSIRRFEVAPGRDDFMPSVMHLNGNRIAVLFRNALSQEEFLKVVDLEGHDVATYKEPVTNGEHPLGPAFACYADNPERFIFLTTSDDQKIGLIVATPQ